MAHIPDRALFDFLEHTADAAFTVTDSGEICSWNSSAEALFGFGRDEVTGKTCFELFRGRGALGHPCVQNTVRCVIAPRITARFRISISRSRPGLAETSGRMCRPWFTRIRRRDAAGSCI